MQVNARAKDASWHETVREGKRRGEERREKERRSKEEGAREGQDAIMQFMEGPAFFSS